MRRHRRDDLLSQLLLVHRLPRHQAEPHSIVEQVVGGIRKPRAAARLAVQVPEVRRGDDQHQSSVQHASIEPVRQDKFNAQRRASGIGKDYLPWLTVRDLTSSGRSHRIRPYQITVFFPDLVRVS